MPVAAPADRRLKRAHLKPGRRRGWLTVRWRRAVGIVVIVAVCIAAVSWATSSLLAASLFRVSTITLAGNERLSSGEVLALLEGLRGRNILSVDLQAWHARLTRSPWVARAELRRVLPSGIHVQLSERHPIGLARLAGSLYLVDATGVVIDEYGPNYRDLELAAIDGLVLKPGGGGRVDEMRAALAGRLVAALAARPDIAERVSHIDVSDAHNAVVMLDRESVLLHLGNENFVPRLQQYLDVGPALVERLADIDYVDLRFDERLYVKPVKGRAAR